MHFRNIEKIITINFLISAISTTSVALSLRAECIRQIEKTGQGRGMEKGRARQYCHLWVTYSSLQLQK